MSDTPELYQGPGPNSDAFDPSRHKWDGNQWWTDDMQHWWDGAQWQSNEVPRPNVPVVQRKRRPPGWWRDFWLGFGGVIVGNIVLSIVLQALVGLNNPVATGIVLAAPWVLNIGALIAFAVIRAPVALGMLLAYGIAFGLVLLAGIFLAVLCFGGAIRVP